MSGGQEPGVRRSGIGQTVIAILVRTCSEK